MLPDSSGNFPRDLARGIRACQTFGVFHRFLTLVWIHKPIFQGFNDIFCFRCPDTSTFIDNIRNIAFFLA
jgi:hypothetical protein